MITELAQDLAKRNDVLKGERLTFDSFSQEIAHYVMPRKAQITHKQDYPSSGIDQMLFDSTAIQSNQILANGQLSWMTPHESRWFGFEPPDELDGNDEAAQWYRKCSEVAQVTLAQSNFYAEIHELYLDRGAFGTAAIMAEPGRKTALTFKAFECGSYSIAEDEEGNVDTLFREFDLTPRQAAQKFGEENLSPQMRKDVTDVKKMDVLCPFLHAIYPRDPASIDPRKIDPKNMPIASVYMDLRNKHICRESGYRESPFMSSRYLKWGRSAYGWSPSWMALPEARQLNFLEKQMDALAEKAVNPPFLVPNTHEGDIDIRAGGMTMYDPNNPNALPREWITQGRYDVGKDRAEIKRQAIKDAYHVDLFRMFAQLDKQMTAREVAERSSEKLIQFSPTFARMTTELFNPLLARTWAILLRAGALPAPPQSVLMQDEGGLFVPEPKVAYSSRIALAIRALENTAFARTMELMGPIAQIRPDVLDNYNFDKISRDSARNDGLPADWLLDEKEVEAGRQARAQAQAEAQQAEQMAMAAKAAGDASKVQPGSMVEKMLKGAA